MGGASCLGVGRPGSGALPHPTARPSGGLPGCCACACYAWPGRAGRPPGRVLVRLTFPLAFRASLFACSAPAGLGLPCLWLLLGFFFFFLLLFPFSPLLRPRCVLLCLFSGLGCLGPWRLVPPPPVVFFSPPPPLCALLSPALRVVRPGVRWALASCSPPPFFLSPPPPFVSGVSCFPVALGLRPPPLFFFLSCCFFFLLRVCCVCSGVSCCVFPVLPVRCIVRVVCAVAGGWCCWFLVSLPFVWGLLVALVARRFRLVVCVGSGARVWSGRRWASSLWCPVPLCCVLWRCAAVWCCGVVPCLLFFCFSPCWWHWFPVVPRWFWAPGRFRVVSVSVLCLCGAVPVCLRRCSLFGALLPSRGWLVFCVVACCVCVFAVGPGCPLLSPGGSWWLPVSCLGGVLWCVPGCCAAPCCCALCRLALRCCALRCFVLLRLVLPHAVLCAGALSFVLGSCAFWRRVLSCPPALCVFCCGVSLCGVVRRCALCRVRPGVSCCAFLVVSALCGVAVWPALPRCPASLCCAPWCCAAAWCRGVLSCRLVGFVSCLGVVVPT